VLYPLSYEGGAAGAGWRERQVSDTSPTGAAYHGPVPTVLVVDDDPVIVALLQVSFEMEGYEVRTASDGAAALAQVEAAVPDLVLLDVMMPGFDGLEVARRLRSDPATDAVPIIMLSAKAQTSDITAGLAVADDYVTKPFDPLELLERVAALIAPPSAERS
jgi:DNA-binding response OmpR family regulator